MGVRKVKPMAEGGILAAISVIMALIGVYVPVIGLAVAFVWPLPIIVLVVRHGLRWGVLSLLVTGVLLAMLIHPLQSINMTVAFGPVGLVLGYAYRRGYGAVRSLLTGMFASTLSKIAVIGLGALFLNLNLNLNPLHLQLEVMDEAFQTTQGFYRSSGLSESELAKMETDFKNGMGTVRLLFPVVIVLAGMLDAYVNFIVAGRVLRRLGNEQTTQLLPFSQWRLPLWVAYLYAFALIGMYWGPQLENELLYQVSLNANLLAGVLGFVQGLAILSYAADRIQVSIWFRVLLAVLFLTNGFFMQVVSMVGMFDIIFDLRRRMTTWKR